MDEIQSFGGVVALWIAASCALWWGHRLIVRRRQKQQLDQAVRAAACVGDAQAVFDAIRAGGANNGDGRLAGETYALLKRIQEHGAFFDAVNTLRVQIQASLGIADHAPLSEVLHLRRDLWAASEIVLVEDPGSFSASFAEPGSYERFRDEATRLLFKSAAEAAGAEDPIDLRLALARKDADAFIAELREAIAAARERDRLPTIAEITAYPLAILRGLPEKLRLAYVFLRALFAYAGDTARTIRELGDHGARQAPSAEGARGSAAAAVRRFRPRLSRGARQCRQPAPALRFSRRRA